VNFLFKPFREKIQLVFIDLEKLGWRPKRASGFREESEQKKLYDSGRSKVLFSFHNVTIDDKKPSSLGIDIIDKRYGWQGVAEDVKFPFWTDLGIVSKKHGLYWGGDWKHFKDVAHVQFLSNIFLTEIQRLCKKNLLTEKMIMDFKLSEKNEDAWIARLSKNNIIGIQKLGNELGLYLSMENSSEDGIAGKDTLAMIRRIRRTKNG